MTRKPRIICDNCAGPMASRVRAVEAMRWSYENSATTDNNASIVCPALCAQAGSLPCSRIGPVRSSEESKLRPLEWLLVIGLWQLKLNATAIATAADIQERTAPRWSNVLDGGLYETYHLDPSRQLENPVEADECYQSAGSKGLPREVERHDCAPRPRGLQLHAVAPPAEQAVHPFSAWCNAATRPTRTRQRRKYTVLVPFW